MLGKRNARNAQQANCLGMRDTDRMRIDDLRGCKRDALALNVALLLLRPSTCQWKQDLKLLRRDHLGVLRSNETEISCGGRESAWSAGKVL